MIRQWRELSSWIYLEPAPVLAHRFAPVRLESLLAARREPVKLAGSALEGWTPITVHLDGAISPRKRDTAFKGAMFAARSGDIVFSKIDARSGAIGVVPITIPAAVVTPEFPVFRPAAEDLGAEFLALVIRTGGFLRALKAKATGTSGRKRVTPEGFLALEVPLPDPPTQEKLVARYLSQRDQADALDRQAEAEDAAAYAALQAALSVSPPPPAPDRRIFIAGFRHLDRWEPRKILEAATAPSGTAATYPILPLQTVGKVAYGLQKSPANRPGTHPHPYLRVANVQRDRLDLGELKQINVPDELMPRYRLLTGDVLLCEGNSPDLVGRGAIWRGEVDDCVHQNHVLRVRLDLDRVDPDFVLAVINSPYGQAYFRSKSKRTTNLASINSKEVAAFPLPCPPLETQKALLAALRAAQAAASARRAEAETLRRALHAEFEAALYVTNAADAV